MYKINYGKFMSRNPYLLHTMSNDRGQELKFYEHPYRGDAAPILVTIDDKVAAHTDFFDLGDFYKGSDYLPVLLGDGSVVYQFEV